METTDTESLIFAYQPNYSPATQLYTGGKIKIIRGGEYDMDGYYTDFSKKLKAYGGDIIEYTDDDNTDGDDGDDGNDSENGGDSKVGGDGDKSENEGIMSFISKENADKVIKTKTTHIYPNGGVGIEQYIEVVSEPAATASATSGAGAAATSSASSCGCANKVLASLPKLQLLVPEINKYVSYMGGHKDSDDDEAFMNESDVEELTYGTIPVQLDKKCCKCSKNCSCHELENNISNYIS